MLRNLNPIPDTVQSPYTLTFPIVDREPRILFIYPRPQRGSRAVNHQLTSLAMTKPREADPTIKLYSTNEAKWNCSTMRPIHLPLQSNGVILLSQMEAGLSIKSSVFASVSDFTLCLVI